MPVAARAFRASCSPVDQAPLMNCTTPTPLPRPSMRSARPKAAVDFPFPLPVWTSNRPFSMVLVATSASCAAFRLAIFALCWSVLSVESVMSFAFQFARITPSR